MIMELVNHYMKNKEVLEKKYSLRHPDDYAEIVKDVTILLSNVDDYDHSLSPERITCIDHGDYQGNQLYIIGTDKHWSDVYFAVKIDYGSCSICDTLEGITQGCYDGPPTEQQTADYMTLALHIVQSLKMI